MKKLAFLLPLIAPLLLAPRDAHADTPPPPCDPDTYTCITVSNVQIGKTLTSVPFSNGLNTGWLGCNSTQKCSETPAGCNATIAACMDAEMTDSRIDLTMVGFWDVSWPEIGKLLITPRKKTNGGNYAITYKLSPLFGIYINALGFKSTVVLDPLSILTALGVPDINAGFDYTAQGKCVFDPWAYAPITCPVTGPPQDLFTLPLSQLTGLGGLNIDQYIQLAVGLQAGTDTNFTWQTDKILVDGGDKPVTSMISSSSIPYDGSTSVQVNVWAQGTIGYSGTTTLKPDIEVDSVAGFSFKPPLKFSVGTVASVPFMGTIPNVVLKKTLIDIPLPDIQMDAKEMNFGDVAVGSTAAKTVKVNNDGKLLLKAAISSSMATVFKSSASMMNVSDGASQDLTVTFVPTAVGPATGKLTVTSNDPDAPTITIVLKGNGIDTGAAGTGGTGGAPAGTGGMAGAAPTAGKGGMVATAGMAGAAGKAGMVAVVDNNNNDPTTTQKGGCGCRTTSSEGPTGGLAFLGVALAFAARRRRNRG